MGSRSSGCGKHRLGRSYYSDACCGPRFLSLLIIDLALLGLIVVIGLTGRGSHRLLALVPAGTLAAIIFYVWAGGVIMLVTWLAAAAVALAPPLRPVGLTAPTLP